MKYLLTAAFLLVLPGQCLAVQADDSFAIFLVRHAEKAADPADPADPGLSDCGEERAVRIAAMITEAGIESIYSTDYQRTRATALPSASALGLDIELYDPRELEEFAGQLLEARKNALVVGHSNTIGVLAGLLSAGEQEEFSEEIYDRLYLVVVSGVKARMILLHQDHHCNR